MDSVEIRSKRVEDSLRRFRSLVKNQYGKDIEIRATSSYLKGPTISLLSEDDLVVPVEANGEQLGTAVIKKALELNPETSSKLTDLIRLILPPVMAGLAERVESSSPFLSLDLGGYANVIPLFASGEIDLLDLHPKLQHSLKQVEDKSAVIGYQARTLSFESYAPFTVYKAAIDVHEIIESWSFLMWNDIRSNLKAVADLVKLGKCTIYIEDILELSPMERDLLSRFLQVQSGEMPTLAIGTRRSLGKLVDDGLIDQGLVSRLGAFTLNLDLLPANREIRKESIELMLKGELQ